MSYASRNGLSSVKIYHGFVYARCSTILLSSHRHTRLQGCMPAQILKPQSATYFRVDH